MVPKSISRSGFLIRLSADPDTLQPKLVRNDHQLFLGASAKGFDPTALVEKLLYGSCGIDFFHFQQGVFQGSMEHAQPVLVLGYPKRASADVVERFHRGDDIQNREARSPAHEGESSVQSPLTGYQAYPG